MMTKLFGVPQWKRFVGGVLLAVFGGGLIIADVVMAYRANQQPAPLLIGVGLLVAWFGGVVIDSKWMFAVTHELTSTVGPFVKAIILRGGNGADFPTPTSMSAATPTDPASAHPTGPPPPPPPPGT